MSEKIQGEQRHMVVMRAAQDPRGYLEVNKAKGCLAAVVFLMQVRAEIRRDATYRIEKPHPDFAQFYRSDNSTLEYYEALARMLKEAQYTKEEVDSAFFDFLSQEAQSNEGIRKHIQSISELVGQATDKVFYVENQASQS